jgi:hypothetical protein
MRSSLGEGYVDVLQKLNPHIPDSSDYVMYWWDRAATLARQNKIKRFGFITTNSITQIFNRKVIQHHLEAKNPLSLLFAIPDHPWVDSAEGAAVRIAMTIGAAGEHEGVVYKLSAESRGEDETRAVGFEKQKERFLQT